MFLKDNTNTNIALEYSKSCGIATFGGGYGFKKSSISQNFHEKIMIFGFYDYNGSPL